MSVWFTSDLHLGHKLVSELRGFASTDEHDSAVMESLYKVGRGDQLWILGDLSCGSTAAERRALSLLLDFKQNKEVKLHLISGNHDSVASIHRESYKAFKAFAGVFDSIGDFGRKRVAGIPLLMSHYPYDGDHSEVERYTQYRLKNLDEWLIHGHTHSTEKIDGKQIHIGWDAWREPVHLTTIMKMMEP